MKDIIKIMIQVIWRGNLSIKSIPIRDEKMVPRYVIKMILLGRLFLSSRSSRAK